MSAGLHGLTEAKNTRNNRSERGADHAPTTVNGRIEANVKAIRLARELLESGETATPDQMAVLRQFSGWGGLGGALDYTGSDWKVRERNKQIRELLGEEAYEQAVMSSKSAYYTPAYVVDTLWDIAGQLGFKGGHILEGSAGIGNILGQMPAEVSGRSDIHAIEIDGTSGGILSLLYPDAKVDIQGFEDTRIPNGSVDLAITNVPFVTGLHVKDKTGDGDLSRKFRNIHDFCIAKNVRKLREGGLGIFISSNGTLDNSKALRDWVVNEGGSDFIGAFRMNNETFGGTPVTSDVIVIRKRVNGQKSPQAIDVSAISGERTAEYQEPGARKAKQLSMDYNKYFIEHPDHMAGEMRFGFEEGDKTYRPTSKGLYPVSGKDQGAMLADFVKTFTEEAGGSVRAASEATPNIYEELGEGVKEGSMVVDKNGNICTAHYGKAVPVMSKRKTGETATDEELVARFHSKKIKGHTKQECFNAYSAIKSALADVMEYQTTHEDNAGLQPLLAKLNKAYDDFVATYGHFNKNNQLAWLRRDVDYPNVFSLETYEEQGDGKGGLVKTYGKADVLKGRVVEKEREPHPETVKDAVVVSMFKNGRIDIPYIAGQLGKSEEAVKREIIDGGLGFEDPATRQVEVSYQYLSGNVREKLRQAEANNENGEYTVNIKALRDVVPMDIPAHLIDFTLGSSWLDPKLYDAYVKDRTDIDVHFTAAGGSWYMKAPSYGLNMEKNRSMGVTSEMLDKTVMGHVLIEAAIQNKTIVVSQTKRHYDGTTETITDREATAACASKIDEIRQDFKEWARQKMQSEADLSARIEREYNDRFNNYVPMRIPDEFVPEFFGGATHKFRMRPHQGKAIVRGTMQPLLLAHEVGTGKTFTLISTAMEMRRLGTARKPMIVVQNATVGQFAASAKELYPNAKILTLEDNDRDEDGRKNFYAKIKYNDWDMIVVPQSTFEFIPDSDERQMQFIRDKIEEKMLVLEQMREADDTGRSAIVRNAEKELASLQAELAEKTNDVAEKRAASEKQKAVARQNASVKAQEMLDRRTDDVENFDDMGIDALLIDEAHEYKHLGFATAMQRGVKGVDPSFSKKSQGVYLKTQAVLEKMGGRNVVFATGTPISNTAAEIWTFMRYLMPRDTMKEYGIQYFDDFVRNFGNIQQMPEFKTSGKFQEVNRFAGYVNLPELVRIWSGAADTVLTKDQEDLVEKIPAMEGGKAQDIYLPQTRALRSVMKYVREQLEEYEKMSGKEKKENSHIPLTMYGIAQGAAVDARLVQVDAEDDPKSKTNEAVRQTLRSLKETDGYKGTVAIFADHYMNKRNGFNLYEDIKKKLVAQGVPASEVVVMKSGMKIKQKLDIFEKVNRGEVRVIMGSTATLGTGVNIQERLHTLIHLDAPNRPMDYTQRNGRILRQGNLHKQWDKPVRVLRFGVEDSLDVTAYQRLKTKGAIADSIMEGDRLMKDSMNNRVLEEEEDVFGDTVAQLSGSEYALLKNNAEKNVRKYESRKRQWEADQTYIHNAKPKLEGQIRAADQRAEEAKAHLQAVQEAFPDGTFTEMTAGKHKFGTVDEMADFIKEHNKKILDAMKTMKETPGSASQTHKLTLSLGGYDFTVKTDLSRETVNGGGTLFAEVHRKMTYSCPELGLEDVPVKQALLRNAVEDITDNVITGKDFAERLDYATRAAAHGRSELEQLKQREGKPFEFGKELEEAKRQLEEYTEAMKEELAAKEAKYAEMDASVEAATDLVVDDDEDDGDTASYRIVDDPQLLNELEDGEWVEAYRVMQVINRDLYPPMAAVRDGDLVEPIKLGLIEQTEEHPELITFDENNKPQFLLNKGQGKGSLKAAYNPYLHTSRTALNDQFTSAHVRPNLVVVRTLVPKSELTSGYKAQYAKDAVGEMSWHSGSVSGQLSELGKPRRVILTRYDKPMEIIPNAEVARMIADQLADTDIAIPYNVVWPQLREELERLGVKIGDEASGSVGEDASFGKAEYVTDKMIAEMNEKAQRGMPRTPEAKRAEAERLGAKLHTPLTVIEDTDAIVHDNPTVQARRRKSKGWYDTKTGEVVIVLPNNRNVEDVAETVFHETVGHKGLRELIGEKGYNDFLREVYAHVKADVRRRIAKIAAKHNWDFEKATDEYLSRLAEKGFEDFDREERTVWQWLKEKVVKAIDKFLGSLKLPKWVKLGDNELRYMLWRSKERMERGKEDLIDMARDIVKREELGLSDAALYRDENWKADEIRDMASRNKIRGASISHFADTAEDIEAVRKHVGEDVYNMIMEYFHDETTSAIYLPSRDLVVVFTNKAVDAEDAECSWFHEQTHGVWHKAFTPEERERYGVAVLDYLKKNDADLYNHIVNKYESDKHKSEACSYLIEKVVRENGSDKFMNADFSGIEEIANFARAIQKFLRDGKREETGNQPQRVEADEKAVQDVQNNPNGRRSQEGEVFRQVIRPKNETEDIWKDGSLGLQERMERGKEDLIDRARDIVKREELGLSDAARYNMGDAPETFKARQKRAAEKHGVVMPGLNDAKMKVVDVPRHQYKGSDAITQACNAAIDRYSQHVEGKQERELKPLHYDNFGTEFNYVISPKSLKEAANHTQNSENIGVHIAVMDKLDEVINNSIEIEEHPDVKKKNGERKWENGFNDDVLIHRFAGAVHIDNKTYRVKTTMKEYRNPGIANGHYTYEVTKIEVLDEKPNTSNGRPNVSNVFVSGANLLQNVEKSYDAGKNLLAESQKADEDTSMYREPDETEDIWKDGSLGLQERITAAATRLAANHTDNKTLRNDAMRAIGGNLSDLRKAMSLQRQFDITTVKRVADLARVLMDGGYLSGLNQQEVKRLLAAVKNSTGHNNIESDVRKVMDIMVENQLRNAEGALHSLESIKGTKVDARGVEVQGQLDAEGAHVMRVFKKARGWERTDIEDAIADAQQRMGSSDAAVAEEAARDYTGLQLALDYAENIKGSKKWSDKEWAFVLHEAYKRKKNGGKPDLLDAADTVVMREKTGFGETQFSDGKSNEPKPIGRSLFGDVYNQFKGKVIQAVQFLANHESGDLLGVFHRKDIGDIDMVWGDEGGGLCHILYKHVNDKDFPTVKELASRLEDIINNGKVDDKHSNADKLVLAKDGYLVTIRRNVRDNGKKIADKNWVLTAYNKDAPATTKAPADGTHGSTAVAPGTSSDAKVATLSEINKLSDNDVADDGIMFRDGDSVEYEQALARDIYEQRVSRGMYQMQEALQDSMLGLKEAMDAVLKAEGKGKTHIEDVAGYENAYLGENRLSSVNQAECAAFAQTLFKPMLEEASKLARTADGRAELTDYMMAKHGLERNEVMARRAADRQAEQEFGAELRTAARALAKDPLDQLLADALDDVRQRRDEWLVTCDKRQAMIVSLALCIDMWHYHKATLPPMPKSRVAVAMPNARNTRLTVDSVGEHRPFSSLQICDRFTPILSPSSSCVRLCWMRAFLMASPSP